MERLGRKPFLLGDEMSAVDFLLAKPLRNADSLGVLAQFPTLDALYRRFRHALICPSIQHISRLVSWHTAQPCSSTGCWCATISTLALLGCLDEDSVSTVLCALYVHCTSTFHVYTIYLYGMRL